MDELSIIGRKLPGIDPLLIVLDALPRSANAAVTGGAIRDLFHRKEPKDIDIAIWGLDLGEEPKKHWLVEYVTGALYLHGWFSKAEWTPGQVSDGYVGSGSDTNDLMQLVVQLEHESGLALDLLFYEPQYRTLVDVLRSHDHTISQFALTIDPDSEIAQAWYLDDYFIGHCWRLRQDNISANRERRVQDVCAWLGWQYHGFDTRKGDSIANKMLRPFKSHYMERAFLATRDLPDLPYKELIQAWYDLGKAAKVLEELYEAHPHINSSQPPAVTEVLPCSLDEWVHHINEVTRHYVLERKPNAEAEPVGSGEQAKGPVYSSPIARPQ